MVLFSGRRGRDGSGGGTGPSTTNTRLFARRHHLAKPSAMQLKGWETEAPPLGSTRGRTAAAAAQQAGRRRGSSAATTATDAPPPIPELPDPARGVYVRVPFAAEPTPLREFLWGLLQGTAELCAAVRAPFATGAPRTLADKMPFWEEAMAHPDTAVRLSTEQARVVRVASARRAEAAAATRPAVDGKKEAQAAGKAGGEGRAPALFRPAPALPPRRPSLNAGWPSPGVGVVLLANAAAVWGVLHANPPF